jgi:hypothetical protein
VIWYAKAPRRATADEFARMDLIRGMHCMCCALKGDFTAKPIEIHHIIRANKRLGHWYTIPLCSAHHRGERGSTGAKGAYVHGGMKAFRAEYGYDDLELWQRLQVTLGLDDSLPPTKVMRRRSMSEAEVIHE